MPCGQRPDAVLQKSHETGKGLHLSAALLHFFGSGLFWCAETFQAKGSSRGPVLPQRTSSTEVCAVRTTSTAVEPRMARCSLERPSSVTTMTL